MHPQMHPLQNVPAAVVDDATDFCSVEGAREVPVRVAELREGASHRSFRPVDRDDERHHGQRDQGEHHGAAPREHHWGGRMAMGRTRDGSQQCLQVPSAHATSEQHR